tara:strand:- start:20744 stop:21025 length:282 start_codon:yes stop_codon:yes gene_type:complete
MIEIDIENNNITEQKYLELAEQMKEIVEEKDNQLIRQTRILNDYKFMVYKTFGIISFLEDIVNECELGTFEQTFENNLNYLNSQIRSLIGIEH